MDEDFIKAIFAAAYEMGCDAGECGNTYAPLQAAEIWLDSNEGKELIQAHTKSIPRELSVNDEILMEVINKKSRKQIIRDIVEAAEQKTSKNKP